MPVSLGEWRVRIGTFMRRCRKEYDYQYFSRKLHNLIKKHKNAERNKENNNPGCNSSSRTGSSPDANRSPSNTARQSASSCDVNLKTAQTAQTGPSRDVNNGGGNASSPTLSQSDVPECDTVNEGGSPCDVINPGHNDVSHTESSCAENSGSSIEKESNTVPGTTDVKIPAPQPCVKDELDNKYIAINLMPHEYTPKSAQISKTDKPEVGISESHSHVPADVHGETDRINRDKGETSDSAPSGIEDQLSDLSPEHSLDTTINTDQRTSAIREVTEYHGPPIYPVLGSGTTSGEADETKGNDCPDMTNILLLRSGDVERNPGPNEKPGNLTELELYLLADNMDSSDFRKVGLALGFTEAELSRFKKDQMGNTLYATYKMLYEWRKTVHESEAREALVVTLQRIKLVQLADSVQKGQVGDDIPSMTEEEIQRVAEEVKHYLAIHLCQIQADPMNSELELEFKRIFTNLTLIEEDKGTKRRTPLLYDNLLRTKVNGSFPKRLLVEGEGGVGKTTFCAKIAWDWIHGKGYQDFKLVLVILLRKTEGKTVGEVVKSYLSDNNPVTAKQLDKQILSNPDDVFLVLDGLDEFAVNLDSNQQIALITLNHLFKSGTVLITSRQWRSDEIRMNADLRKVFAFIAVEGFSAENLSSYITKFFHPDAASSEDLSKFISNNDVIRENMAPYPIYTAMLCTMWKEFDGERREAMSKLQTFSQLFNQMIDFLVDHHLSKHTTSLCIVEGKLGEHCSDIRSHLIHIGRIAFQGLLERRLVFTEEEFQSYPGSIDVGCKVGVLTREKKILPRRDRRNTLNSVVQSVQFPHKLFQEYLSGMYHASLCKSNRNEYDRLIANIITRAVEFRYLLYFTSAQQKEVGLDIVSRLIASKTGHQPFGSDDDEDFIVDVAYESQDQAVAKAVADHLSTMSIKTLKITKEMQAHTVSGHSFIMNHREVDDLIIEKPCGRTASEDLAEFMCSSRSLRTVTIDLTQVTGTMHDVFYSVLANKAVDSKIEKLCIVDCDLKENDRTASSDLAKFICLLPCLTDLTMRDSDPLWLHDDFYHELARLASSSKIETLCLDGCNLKENDPTASRDLARFLCLLPCLTDLTMRESDHLWLHDDFYYELALLASSSKNHFFNKKLHLDERSQQLKQIDLGQQIEYIRHLVHSTLSEITPCSTSRALQPLSSHQGSVQQQIEYSPFVTAPDLDIPSTCGINARWDEVPEGIDKHFREQYTASPTTVEIDAVSDVQLDSLAVRIPPDKYHHLSNELGIEYNEALHILKQHGSDSKPAMRECLSVWNSRTGGSFTKLNMILNSVHLGGKYHSEGIFDQTGGELQIPSYGLTLSIPPGALQEGSSVKITLNVLTDIPTEITLRHNETLVTHGFQCLTSGLQFVSLKPVRLKIPHCANLIDPTKVQVVLYSMNHGGEADRIEQTSQTCRVTNSHVEISLKHFTQGSVAFIKDLRSWKYKRMSFMPFLPKIMPTSREMMLKFCMVNKPHGNSWRDVHVIGDQAEYRPAKDDDDEMNVKDDDMEVTCQLKDRDTLKENVSARFIDKTKQTVYFKVDFNGKVDDLLVKLQVIQSNLPMDIMFRTRFLASPADTDRESKTPAKNGQHIGRALTESLRVLSVSQPLKSYMEDGKPVPVDSSHGNTEYVGHTAGGYIHQESPGVAPAQPSSTESPRVAPAQPSSAESPGVAPAQPSSTESPGVAPAQPSSTESPGVAPAQPSSTESLGVAPAQPISSEILGVAPAQPSSTESPAVVPSLPSSTESSAVVPSQPSSPESPAVVLPQPSSTESHAVVPSQPSSTEGPAVVPSLPSSTESPAVVPSQPSSPESPAVVLPQPSSTESPAVVPSQPSSTESPGVAPAQPSSTESLGVAPAQPSSTESPGVAVSWPSSTERDSTSFDLSQSSDEDFGITETLLGKTFSASPRLMPSKTAAIPQDSSAEVALKPGTQLHSEKQGHSSYSVHVHVNSANSSIMARDINIGQQIQINISRLDGLPRKRKKNTHRKTDSYDEDEQTKEGKQRKSHGSKNDNLDKPRGKRKKKFQR